MRRTTLFLLLVASIIAKVLCSSAGAFDDNAHEALSLRATRVSTLDNFLKSVLPFEFFNGREEIVFNGLTVERLINQGAFDEDRPILWRPRHHFHNPRLAWGEAGWRPPPFSTQLGDSSVKWSQNENQTVGGKHSWKDARDSYFQALTATTDSERKRLYAETFKSLGHLIHLVQDAAVPSHTRNDTHVNYKGIGDPDSFHGWAELATGMIANSSPLFNSSLLNQSAPNAIAPVPISRIIDSTDGDIGTLALSPGLNIGIAEYSSANFFSDDTINSPHFQSPLSSQVEVRAPEYDATRAKLRRYVYFRPGFGEQDYPLALASAMRPYVIDPLAIPTENGLDDKVFQGYGAKLFPRAIGYSAGLIDYFFRAQVDTADPPLGYVLVPWEARRSSIDVQGVKVIGDGQQTGNGTIQMVLLHENSFRGLRNPPTSPGPKPLVVVSNEVPFTISSQGQTVTFPFAALPWPTEVIPALCCYGNGYMGIIVYRGTLGQETNTAVVAGGYCHDLESGDKWERFYSFENATLDGIAWAYIGEC